MPHTELINSRYEGQKSPAAFRKIEPGPEQSLWSFRRREFAIVRRFGPLPEEVKELIETELSSQTIYSAHIALDQWRFSRLSPEEQRMEQLGHREGVKEAQASGHPIRIHPDDLIAPNNPYINPSSPADTHKKPSP